MAILSSVYHPPSSTSSFSCRNSFSLTIWLQNSACRNIQLSPTDEKNAHNVSQRLGAGPGPASWCCCCPQSRAVSNCVSAPRVTPPGSLLPTAGPHLQARPRFQNWLVCTTVFRACTARAGWAPVKTLLNKKNRPETMYGWNKRCIHHAGAAKVLVVEVVGFFKFTFTRHLWHSVSSCRACRLAFRTSRRLGRCSERGHRCRQAR